VIRRGPGLLVRVCVRVAEPSGQGTLREKSRAVKFVTPITPKVARNDYVKHRPGHGRDRAGTPQGHRGARSGRGRASVYRPV
jgi:hypothetical protein